MDWQLDVADRGSRVSAVYQQIRDAVLDGRLPAGEQLPPTRELAVRLQIARGTVTAAYDRLTAEGFLCGRVGAGTFVAATTRPTRPARRPAHAAPVAPRRAWRGRAPMTVTAPALPFDLSVGLPDPALFPLQTWRRLVAAQLRPGRIRSAGYHEPAGPADLRAALARHLGLARGVRAGADDVVVTAGAQQAFALVVQVLLDPGAVAAVEEPGYPPVRRLLAAHGARVVGVPVDGEGLVVDALPDAARLVYVTPSHQFPLGVAMSPQRRAALLEWAAQHRAAVVEDDYDSEYRYAERPLESLQGLDRAGRVIYVGTLSKTLLPALRIGFLVAPPTLRPALLAARQLADWHGDPVTQAAVAQFVDEGLLARHVRRTGRRYAARHARLTGSVATHLGPWWEPVRSVAGLHLALRARPGVAAAAVARHAAELGVRVETLDRYCADRPQEGLVVGFGLVDEQRIAEAVRRLARASHRVAPR